MAWMRENAGVLSITLAGVCAFVGGSAWLLVFIYDVGYNEGVDDTRLNHALIEIENLRKPVPSHAERKLAEFRDEYKPIESSE